MPKLQRIKEYCTPHSLKRVNKNVAIDYVMLNLKLLSWAHDMLKEDNDDGDYDTIFSEIYSWNIAETF